MSIASLADYNAAVKQQILFAKSKTLYTGNNWWLSLWDTGSLPAAGSLAIGNTANGIVPTDATTGAPNIIFSTGSGYITRVDAEISNNNANTFRVMLYDRLFHAGSYAFNAAVTLASQPSFSSRVPGGTDFTGLRLFAEVASAFSGSFVAAVTYTDQSGNMGHTTGTNDFSISNSAGRVYEFPLASGDSGIQKIESVTSTVSSAGTFNVFVARPLWIAVAQTDMFKNTGSPAVFTQGMELIGLPQIWGDSCLALMIATDDLNIVGACNLMVEVASK